jgi:hypothetical protein
MMQCRASEGRCCIRLWQVLALRRTVGPWYSCQSLADSVATSTARMRQELQTMARGRQSWMPYFLHLLGVEALPNALAGMAPDLLRTRVFEALQQWLLNYSRHQPYRCHLKYRG